MARLVVLAVLAALLSPAAPVAAAPERVASDPLPLAGRVIVVDPGHQLGNSRHRAEIDQPVPAGNGQTKPCNTTGTATDGGFPEATFTWRVARRLAKRLRALGATVVLTRTTNSRAAWGPCVDVRGRLGNAGYAGWERAADLKLSIHGDGSLSGGRGFHVIVAAKAEGRAASTAFGRTVRGALHDRGFRNASYAAGGRGFTYRGDLATLNLSEIPTAMVELGNMRSAADARVMASRAGQQRYAAALAGAVRRYLR
ncbi:N-acetylmuramoyl-L-alanine amidase family protein [Nocardioides nitrophenolicus]|uniref:N-acetylmuramoyl-L-alanine amidase family protein n=1 Tax=Nocardioides nitrophenolicus TaxID=60489 RepID=UPI00195D30A6|nr:N-acetylmuramoyl-L-alanine amidase [Nocardioides nitrophenolicus]MBM7519662.1 N-acetylmuramoyl-L-alanine amidase [Nocardioides nitrophenolicus]